MTRQTKPDQTDKKKERLAKALRENLLRRKAWQRAQKEKQENKKPEENTQETK